MKGAVTVAVGGIEGTIDRARSLVRDAAAHLMASFSALRSVLEDQNAMLVEISESLGRVGAANFTAAAGRMVNEFVDEIVRVSHESMRIIEQLLETSEHVNAIVARAERIDNLARETRFIALNARIETQRAGEAGRTFKVVADEVKRLAAASAEISTQIRGEVELCFQSLQQTRHSAEGLAGHDMSTIIDSRAALVNTVERLDAVNKAVQHALAKVTASVAEAIRALQFEDLVSQLLAETARRVKSLAALL
ncbi:MAG TPA: methyl-accepting chemotaxis protein, partial [Polyangiaceae bacterium]|nr:methyl-accepting chemotaxis protein [Polyangiaceae bacterium]